MREASTALACVFGDETAARRVAATHPEPEVRLRMHAARVVLTNREWQRETEGCTFPRDGDGHWPCIESREYKESGVPEFYRVPWDQAWDTFLRDPKNTGGFCDYYEALQRERTRAGLRQYVGRTGDWDTVRRVLWPP